MDEYIKISNSLFKSNILNKISFENAESIIFLTHTRWATVGEVNISNCHPLIVNEKNNYNFYSMNGDIINFKELYSKHKIFKNKTIDKSCSNDLIVLNNVIKSNDLQKLRGSFVILNHSLNNPSKVMIYKKGSQGLYLSKDEDENIILASDVYGLVNRSTKFNVIKNNSKFFLDDIEKDKKNLLYKKFKDTIFNI